MRQYGMDRTNVRVVRTLPGVKHRGGDSHSEIPITDPASPQRSRTRIYSTAIRLSPTRTSARSPGASPDVAVVKQGLDEVAAAHVEPFSSFTAVTRRRGGDIQG